ncbi:exodeoxyribonuclease VII small subunit [Candidatus Uhrbacteria bacterium]|nr:exodeoxyribonuclease VII small subunit [Candidatus Uhrbacteria bacterium]
MTLAKTKKDQSFQEAFDELEKIVKKFEEGKLDLDESISLYERGLELAAVCKKRLAAVENRVQEIKKKFGDLDD